jgi:hypothetical protein
MILKSRTPLLSRIAVTQYVTFLKLITTQGRRGVGIAVFAAALVAVRISPVLAQTNVLTYHYDNFRTGWNASETKLTPASVVGQGFGLLQTVNLDERVDAQPLLVTGVDLPGQGTHDVLYVVTENDSVYGIDAESGTVLMSVSLGAPVPMSAIPPKGACNKNSQVLGIMATPVIDPQAGLIYVMSYTWESGAAVYRLHALRLATLQDAVPSAIASASRTLPDGTTLAFSAANSRQRPALLLANNTVYAGFGSFCDFRKARGWVLGWQTGTLAPLPNSKLTNMLPSTARNFFLTSVWMSGSGLAADQSGSVYFVTGNTDNSGTAYNSQTNPAESVVKLSPDLLTMQDFFTPGGASKGEVELDIKDLDFGSGGILLLPPQGGAHPNLAAAAGKAGVLYLLNRDALGGYVPSGPDNVLAHVAIGQCWCGQSYFTGSDGVGRVVSSGGSKAMVWQVRVSPTTSLKHESTSAAIPSFQGFFTSVSSNGTTAGSAVIWAVGGPKHITGPQNITLLAFDAADASLLFSADAGPWPNAGRANTVPVAANGYVYVAGYKQVQIFGLAAVPGRHDPRAPARPPGAAVAAAPGL